jgi:hypothetical protein
LHGGFRLLTEPMRGEFGFQHGLGIEIECGGLRFAFESQDVLQRGVTGAAVRVGELGLAQECVRGGDRESARTAGKRAEPATTYSDTVGDKRLRWRERGECACEPSFG